MHDDLTALVTGAGNGDQQAWDELVDRYAPLIWSICRRYRLGRADAEDVGQSVWLQLVDQLASLRDPAALPGWLATTIQRECGRVLRAARKQQTPGHPARNPGHDHGSGRIRAAQGRAPRGAARGIHAPASRLPAADLHAHPGPSGALRRDQRQAGHPSREHRAQPQPLPGETAPLSGWILRPVRASVPLWREPPFRGGVSHLDAVG